MKVASWPWGTGLRALASQLFGSPVQFVKEGLVFRGLAHADACALGHGRLRRVLTLSDPERQREGNALAKARGAF
jgi:hypothetical protein